MDVQDVLSTLQSKGKATTAKTYLRHGVKDETYGVSHGELGKLQKKLKQDHRLAQRLWRTKIHDARILATKIADPTLADDKLIQRWVKDVKDHVLSGAVATFVAQSSLAESAALEWIDSPREFTASTGWAVIAELATKSALKVTLSKRLITRIKREIHESQNRVRHTMNGALIAIGGSMPDLFEPAFKAARAIGRVDVDHGDTSCKTPDAVTYISKMIARTVS